MKTPSGTNESIERYLLNQMKAFGTYLRDGGLYSDVVGCENLLNEIRFKIIN